MTTLQLDYTYVRAHFPNNNSWYRELVFMEDKLIGEIKEPVASTLANKIYEVHIYRPFKVANGYVDVCEFVRQFDTVTACKDFINAGGLIECRNTLGEF